MRSLGSAFRARPAGDVIVTLSSPGPVHDKEKDEKSDVKPVPGPEIEAGVSSIDATQAVWGKLGLRFVILGLAMIMIIFELDNSTVYVYNNYSTSSFKQLSTLGTLSTAATIIFAVVKPPIAKISDVIGRGETLVITVSFYVVSYVLMASATSIGPYATGMVFYSIGQSGTNVMTNVIISDITTPRWRGFAIGIAYFPFLVTPWVSAFIVDSAVRPNGIGWRWGIGMFAILMPFGASFITGALMYYKKKAENLGILKARKRTLYGFCSEVDLGGVALFVTGLVCLLLPLTIAAQLSEGWRTSWVIALIVLGVLILACLPVYEKLYAAHPVLPVTYFKNPTIVLACLLIGLDSIGFNGTHTYLFAWASVSHNLTPLVATFLVYTNGVMQTFIGILAGWYMLRTGRYKWLVVAAAMIRLIGYGVMVRLRGQDNTLGELFGQQLIQGAGSGIIATTLVVAPQITVPRPQIAQVLALVYSFNFLGSALGSTISGAIYTNTMREALWKWLGNRGSDEVVNKLYNSITGELPQWGSPERIAINFAYSEVITYITYAAIGASVPSIVLALFLPDLELPSDRSTIISGAHGPPADVGDLQVNEDRKQ